MSPTSLAILAGALVVALALSLLAAESTRPLRARALGTVARRND